MTTKKQYEAEIIEFLRGTDCLQGSDVISVEPLPSRSIAACIQSQDRKRYFVKKYQSEAKPGTRHYASLSKTLPITARAAPFSPRILFENNNWCVQEYLHEFDRFSVSFEPVKRMSLAPKLGHALGKFASSASAIPATGSNQGANPQAAVRLIEIPSPSQYANMPGLDRDLFLRTEQQCSPYIKKLRNALTQTVFVHGDLLGTNILLSRTEFDEFSIVDWDHCGIGDPAWDTGHLLAALIRRWISTSNLANQEIQRFFENTNASWGPYSLWFQEFDDTYHRQLGSDVRKAEQISKTVMVAGHAILERCRNLLSYRGIFSQRDTFLLFLAEQFLSSPEQSVDALYIAASENV